MKAPAAGGVLSLRAKSPTATLQSASSSVTLSQNQAARWGGGLYVGFPVANQIVGAQVTLDNASVTFNSAGLPVVGGGASLLPAEIATEQVATNLIPSFPAALKRGQLIIS